MEMIKERKNRMFVCVLIDVVRQTMINKINKDELRTAH